MAYTATTSSTLATLVGTSGNDSVTAPTTATKSITVNSFEGNDSLTLGTALSTSGSVGMGAGLDSVTVGGVVINNVNVTLGDAVDTYTTGGADNGVTVGGQGGADTITLNAAVTLSRYAGGQGKDSFVAGAVLGTKTTIIGGSEVDTIGTSTTRFTSGTNNFINGQKGADSIFITGLAGTTVHGGSEADTINNNGTAATSLFSGDNGADSITDNSGANTLSGGGGADTITAGLGADTLTGGLGKDDFIVNDIVNAAAVEQNEITDFTVADDQVGNFSATDIEGLAAVTDLVEAGNAASIAAGNLDANVTKVTAAYSLGTAGTGQVLSISSNTAFTTATLQTALRRGGSHALTNGATALDAADGFIVFYDDNADSYAAVVTTAGGVAVGTTSTDFVVANLVKFDGVADASTIASSNVLDFVA